jgi:hypothetical protein
MRRILGGLATTAFLLLSCSSVQPPLATDVCKINKNSAAFDRKSVVVRAEVRSDLLEHTFLTSADCPAATVSIEMRADAEGGEAFKQKLLDVMPDGTMIAVFTGTFEWRPNETPSRILNVSSVRDLVVEK